MTFPQAHDPHAPRVTVESRELGESEQKRPTGDLTAFAGVPRFRVHTASVVYEENVHELESLKEGFLIPTADSDTSP
jgi:hypothetical protein